MDTAVVVAIVVVVAVVLIAGWAIWSMQRKKKTEELRERFGPEYERTVSETGKQREAERELSERQKRVEKYRLRELSGDQQRQFVDEWRRVQASFVDDPNGSIQVADSLVWRVMEARGYPMTNFEQSAADVSVDHPEVVKNYRAAHEIAQRSDRHEANTEDLRQAMVHYRALFEDLLGAPTAR